MINLVTQVLTLVAALAVIFYVSYAYVRRRREDKRRKEMQTTMAKYQNNYTIILRELIDDLQQLQAYHSTLEDERESALVFKKFCKFVGYPDRIEIEIQVNKANSQVTLIHPDVEYIQRMYVIKLSSGSINTLVKSDKFKESCKQVGFHIYGY